MAVSKVHLAQISLALGLGLLLALQPSSRRPEEAPAAGRSASGAVSAPEGGTPALPQALPLPPVPADPRIAALPPGERLFMARWPIIPVQGVKPQALRDTFPDKRGKLRIHEAIDIMAPRGTPVLAVDDGPVVRMSNNRAGGITLYQTDPTGRLSYYYAHLEGYAPGIKEGMRVRRGTLLGYVGSTGNASATAPHLHFAVYHVALERRGWRGTPVNPYQTLRQAEAIGAES